MRQHLSITFIADEMAGKANIEHQGDSANSEAEKVRQVNSGRNVRPEQQKGRQVHIIWRYAASV